MALKIVGTHQNTSLPAGTADNDLTPPYLETEGNETVSESDTSTERGFSPADRHNINAPYSDRPITSLPFIEWPNGVRQQMLISMLVKEGEPIIPYYHEGSVEGTRDETKNPNYNITMLLATAGSPQLYQQALETFYSQNVWEFRNPRVALWWLKKLGTKATLLRHINIHLTQGWWGIGSTPSEKLWYILLVWMKPRVTLSTIHVSFAQWDHAVVHPKEEPPMKYFPVAETRLGVWSTLLSFRGLNVVDVTPGPFVPNKYAAALVRSMILVGDQVDAEAERLRRRWRRQVYLGT